MTNDKLMLTLFDEIPSGEESDDRNIINEEDVPDDMNLGVPDIDFDYNLDYFRDADLEAAIHSDVGTDNAQSIDVEDIISDKIEEFSDDDMIPRAELATKLNVNKFVWKTCVSNYLAPANFCEDFGPTCIPPEVETPVEVFSCLFPDILFEHITFETNLYATQASAKSGKPFTLTNIQEIKCFFCHKYTDGRKTFA